jgi:hypothetical protein
MGMPERAKHRTVRCWLSIAGDDLHLDPTSPAGEWCSDLEKIGIQIHGRQAKVISHRLPVEGDAEGEALRVRD